jgi:hypothetical protein
MVPRGGLSIQVVTRADFTAVSSSVCSRAPHNSYSQLQLWGFIK